MLHHRSVPTGALRRDRAPARQRRGATTVFVAVLSVVLVGMTALAVDLSRLRTGVNELQTVADAAALNGALLLQNSPAATQESAIATFGGRNEAFGARAALSASDVEPGVWNPTTNSFTPNTWTSANAVRVTARGTARLLFGRFLSGTTPTPSRRAVAWVANVTGTDCLRPWGISRSVIESAASVADITTQAGINSIRTLLATPSGPAQLTLTLSPNVNGGPAVTAPTSTYQAMTGDQNASPNSYESLVTGAECGDGEVEFLVGATFQQPGQGNQVAQRADAIVRQTQTESGPCKKRVAGDATCYDPTQPGFVAGRTIVVPITVPAAQPNRVSITMLAEFRLMCAFTDDFPGNPLGPSPETCPWLQSIGRTATGYRRGTIVGYPLSGAMDLGAGTELGNTRGLGQRLILVQ